MSAETVSADTLHVDCCIAGGGPAGMMLGFPVGARRGVETVVLEKHADFLRDFRGDTIHPSTLDVVHELGLLDEFLQRPHQEVKRLRACISDVEVTIADFSHVPARCKFIALMPQWDFLNFVAEHAKRYPAFRLCMQTEVVDLIEEDGRVVGIRAESLQGPLEIRAALTVGADGRRSTVRERSGLQVLDQGAPIDVLWMRISRQPDDPDLPMGRLDGGRMLVLIYRGDFWQAGFVIPKGGYDELRGRGIEAFREEIATIAPFLRNRTNELRDWDDVKLLTVVVDRLQRWHKPGLLCIGDAAHAMSPVGGVGINLAIQDAVATANILAAPLRNRRLVEADLAQVQRRREFPVRLTQRLQVLIQNRLIRRAIGSPEKLSVPWPVRLLQRFPFLQRIPARLVGIGFRPEHVQTPDESERRAPAEASG